MVRPWNAVLECDEFCADGLAFRAQQAGVGAGELQRGFPGFGAGVAEEGAVEAGDFGEAERELYGGASVVEEVAGVDEPCCACSVMAAVMAGWL